MSTATDPQSGGGEPEEDSWETCDLDKLKLNDTAGPSPTTVKVPGSQQAQQGSGDDYSLEFNDDPPGGSGTSASNSKTTVYRPSLGLSSAGTIALTTVEHDAPIDPALTAALDNPRERVKVLQFEDQILRFMKSAGQQQLEIPPISSYHRLIVHRLAQRFNLEHQATDAWTQTPSDQRSVLLLKTPQSIVPRFLLIDLVEEKRAETAAAPKPGLKLMRRERPGDGKGGNRVHGGKGGTPEGSRGAGSSMSVSERERAYAEARARIFGTKSSTDEEQPANGGNSSSSSNHSEASSKRQSPGGPSSSAAATNGGRQGEKDRANSNSTNTERSSRQEEQGGRSKEPLTSAGGVTPEREGVERSSSGERPPTVNARGWVDQRKVTWRNREAELSDPDFVRNRHAYRPSQPTATATYPTYPMVPPSQQQQTPPPPHMGAYMVGHIPAPNHQMAYPVGPPYYAPHMQVDYSRLPPGAMPMPYGVYPGGMPVNSVGGGYGVRRSSPPPPPPNSAYGGAPSSSTEYNSAFPPLG